MRTRHCYNRKSVCICKVLVNIWSALKSGIQACNELVQGQNGPDTNCNRSVMAQSYARIQIAFAKTSFMNIQGVYKDESCKEQSIMYTASRVCMGRKWDLVSIRVEVRKLISSSKGLPRILDWGCVSGDKPWHRRHAERKARVRSWVTGRLK